MIEEINLLKEKLDLLIEKGAPYEEIYKLSCIIDKKLIVYYGSQEYIKGLANNN